MNCSNCSKKNLIHLKSNLSFKYEHPLFNFNYITANDKYNLKAIEKKELEEFKILLMEKIIEISTTYTTANLFALRKPHIMEALEFERIKFSPNKITCSNDTKIYVFRVTSKYRMLCLFSDIAPIFHIIGFDFRFNAYDHG